MDDIRIFDLFLQRDEEAIRQTEMKYGRLLISVADNILRSREDARECLNDTYLGAWEAIPPARPQVLSAYLCRIARNLALKKYEYIHAAKRNPIVAVSFDELEAVLADKETELAVEDKYSDDQLAECIRDFLATLDDSSRNVFIRRYWYFDSIKDIVHRYCISKSKVESILFRTRRKLRVWLDERGLGYE